MKKIWRKQRLLLKLLLMSLALVLISLLVMYGFMIKETKKRIINDQGQQMLALGQEVADHEKVIEVVASGQTSQELQDYARTIENRFGLDYLVIIRADSIRLTHPNKNLIGSVFQGENDQHRALDQGESYYHTGQGPLGRSLRTFVPVYNQQKQVIGAISLGITLPNLQRFIDQANRSLIQSFVASLLIGAVFSLILAFSLKEQMLGMEPQEIASVLEERNAIFQKTRDPILLVDKQGQIQYLNEAAKRHWPNGEKQAVSQIFSGIDLNPRKDLQFIEAAQTYRSYVASMATVKPRKKVKGYMLILRDTSELQSLITQLDHSEYFADQLAQQLHDFMNKIHVIYGLAEFERLAELKDYLDHLSQDETTFNQHIQLLVNNSALAGHLLIDQAKTKFYDDLTIEREIPSSSNYQETSLWLDEIRYFERYFQDVEASSTHPSQLSLALDYQDGELITDIWLDELHQETTEKLEAAFEKRPSWQVDRLLAPTLHLRLIISYGG